MGYHCKKFQSIECIGCGDCCEDEAEEYDDITEEDLTDDSYEENWYGDND